MIAVQTLNLCKYHNSNDIPLIKLHLIMSLISSYLLRRHYDEVILYCDTQTTELLKESFYTKIRILPNNILVNYGYGTLAKLFTYSNVEEEYIHFDIDYFLFNKIKLENELICAYSETKEKVYKDSFNRGYSDLIDKLKISYNEFGFNVINENYALNMCVFGVPKNYRSFICDYFKKLNEYTETNIETIYSNYSSSFTPQYAIEQYIPAQFFLQNNLNIKELNEYENYQIKKHFDYIRLYEMKTFSLVGEGRFKNINIKEVLSKYMNENLGHHLWASKGIHDVDKLLMKVSKEMFTELYDKINFILEKNFPIDKNDANNKKLI
jgi:hypothetical protein